MAHVLVTGGAGFIGSNLVDALFTAGHTVRVLDNLSTGSLENLVHHPSVEFVEGDIADFATVREAMRGCELVFHQAALVFVTLSVEDPTPNHIANVDGTFHIFEAARQEGIQRVVYATSSAVYGDLPGIPKRETDPISPISPYGASKLIGENYANVFNRTYGMSNVGLRYMNVFGPRQNPTSAYSGVLSIFCSAALQDRGVKIYGDGLQTRDFVYVQDVVQANMRAGFAEDLDSDQSLVFNVGRGEQTSLLQIVEALRNLTGNEIPIEFCEGRAGDIKHSVADITLISETLGYNPTVAVQDGLQSVLDWFSNR